MSTSANEWLKWAIVFGLGPGPQPGGVSMTEVLRNEGFTVLSSCKVRTTANLNATYNNGSAGVGATLTNAGTHAALVINGVTLALNDRVLVYSQNSAFQNGIYYVSNVGSGSTNWVLTRATDFDSTGEIIQYNTVYVSAGTVGNLTFYYLTSSTPLTVGTGAINFAVLNFFNIFQTDQESTNKILNLVFVSPQGDDIAGNGGYLNPYQTITHAISQITDSSADNQYAICFTGSFSEVASSFKLKPNISFIGNGQYTSVISLTGGAGITLDTSFDGETGQVQFLNCAIYNPSGNYFLDLNSSSMASDTHVYITGSNILTTDDIRITKIAGQDIAFSFSNSNLHDGILNGGALSCTNCAINNVEGEGTTVNSAAYRVEGGYTASISFSGTGSDSATVIVTNSLASSITLEDDAVLTIDPQSAAKSSISGGTTNYSPNTSSLRTLLQAAQSGDNFDITKLSATILVSTPNTLDDPGIGGNYINLTSEEAINFGDPLYVTVNNRVGKADASNPAKFPAQYIAGGSTFGVGETVPCLIIGDFNSTSWTFTAGGLVYVANGGGLTQSTIGLTRIQPIGRAINENLVTFIPTLSKTNFAETGANTDITSLLGVTGGVSRLASLGSTTTYSGNVYTGTAGEILVFGDVVYMKSDGKLWKADADAATLFPSKALCVQAAGIAANATGLFLSDGFARLNSWSFTVGGALYLSATAGAITQTAPVTTDSCTQPIGTAFASNIIEFKPSGMYITHV